MPPERRKMLGNLFLVLTIFIALTAMSQGGLWWAAVTLFASISLWGIGGRKDPHP